MDLRCAIAMFIAVVMFSRAGCSCFRNPRLFRGVCDLIFLIVFILVSDAVVYDPLDPMGNITIKWDVMSWTPDGYVVSFSSDYFSLFLENSNPRSFMFLN